MRQVLIFLVLLLYINNEAKAQYATSHHIAPAPWQYWSDANEAVISTLENQQVSVTLYRSDGTLVTTLNINGGDYAVSYRFSGNPPGAPRNQVGTTYSDRGLIVEASAPVLVNLRNIASDIAGTNNTNIKGNASLVSLGSEAMGRQFRLGYYRSSFGGLNTGNPIYSVMAVENGTNVLLDGILLETLNAGESRMFNAPTGALLEANNPVTVNVGSYGDTPTGCGGNGEDGTFTQLPPVTVLSNQYVVVRGDGVVETSDNAPEQTTIIATENNTTVVVTNYDNAGVQVGTPVNYSLNNAGDFQTFHHGDGVNQYSSSFIMSDNPIAVYTGTAVSCETDVSTVLPIGGCSGTNDIRTQIFVDYNLGELPYFCFIILESDTIPVYVDGTDIELLTGNNRTPIGSTGFYMIRFENTDVGILDPIVIESAAKLTTSIVQQGVGYSMSGFFSAFNERLAPPDFEIQDCEAMLVAEAGLEPYQWFLNGELINGAEDQAYIPEESGNYSVSGTKICGETLQSTEVFVPYVISMDLDLGDDLVFCEAPFQHTIVGTPQNIEELGDSVNFKWYQNGILLSHTGSVMTVTEPGTYTVVVSYDTVECTAADTITIKIADFDINLGDDMEDCDMHEYTIMAEIESDEDIDISEVQFLWSTGETTQEITVSETNLYWVEVTYLGCTEIDEVFVSLSESPQISLGENIQKCPEEEVTISVTFENEMEGVVYFWYHNDQPIAGTTSEIAVTEYGTYRVEVDNEGCISEDEIVITGYPNNQNCVITQGMSPNGSLGQNDNFDLTFLANRTGIESLQVYNRNGTLVYKKQNYIDEWTGLSDSGDELPTGVYYYVISFSGQDSQYGTQYTGWVYINRGL